MLENILIDYFGLKEDNNKEEFHKSYEKLIHLIYDLGKLGIFYTPEDRDVFIENLDKIYNEDTDEYEY